MTGTHYLRTRPNHERQATAGAAVSDMAFRSPTALGTAAALLPSPRFAVVRQSTLSFELAPAAPSARFTLVQPATPPQRGLR